MDCLEAQAAISEALDGATPDAAALEAAKQHCRECADCISFVRALNLVKRAPLPEPPTNLTNRVMATVRKEAVAQQTAVETAAAPVLAASAGPGTVSRAETGENAPGAPAGQQAGASAGAVPLRGRHPRPAVLAAWVAAAAVLVAAFGTVGVMGVRMMAQGPTLATSDSGLASAPRVADSQGQAQSPIAESAPGSATKDASTSSASGTPSYIVYSGSAYRLVGPSTVTRSQLRVLGATQTALDGATLLTREVLAAADNPAVFVQDDQGRLLEFAPVERKYAMRTYRLKSSAVTAYGEWPTLPADIAKPTAADGSPTFSATGSDPLGVKIYRKTTGTDTDGIAIAPGSPADDPAGGNPNWTWWTPTP